MGKTGWKTAIPKIAGKTIQSIVVAEDAPNSPTGLPDTQLFLLFTDGTYYELYGDIQGRNDLDVGGVSNVKDYVKSRRIVVEACK